jgi:hypothetical protein
VAHAVIALLPFDTIVGYGNQSPVTEGGRALVGAFGWLSIIAFGGIIIYSSANWTAIVDDLFHRVNMNWLSRPAFAAPLWGVMSALWIVRIAARARTFWSERVVDYEVTQGDSMWFAYISTLTGKQAFGVFAGIFAAVQFTSFHFPYH